MKDVKVYSAKRINFKDYFQRVWKYKSLLRVLAIRDIKVQYAQTLLGITWAFIQPIVAVIIYTVFFYILLNIQTGEIPYPVFVLPGILAWFHFTQIISDAGTSLQNNQELIQKIEFPKIILPLSKLVSGLTNVLITLVLLFVMMIIYGQAFHWSMLLFPFFLFLNIICGFAIALWLSALTIQYRDFQHIIPYLISFGIWITPVFYPTTIVPVELEKYLYLNPVAGILAGYRWCLLGQELPSWHFVLGFIPMVILLIWGFRYFLKIENKIVDYI